MKEISKIMGGADLTHPKMSTGWILGAVISVVLLLAVVAVGTWLFTKAKTSTKTMTDKVTASSGGVKPFFGS